MLYTKVGAPIVARTILEKRAVFGGEENGGLIFPQHQHCRDGAMGLAVVLELLAATERGLSDLLADIPVYYLKKNSIPYPSELKGRTLKALIEAFEGKRIETLDGVKVHYENGWALVRPSGTEAIFRVFSEARTEEEASKINAEAVSVLKGIIGRLARDA